jgi:pSer/pThr/pTyr-binding forkhead associated (FHA) protein
MSQFTVILHQIENKAKGKRFWLHEGETVTVGRSAKAEISLPDSGMSAIQFRLTVVARVCKLVTMNEAVATIVNGQRTSAIHIRSGDVIRAGTATLEVEFQAKDEAVESTSIVAPTLPISEPIDDDKLEMSQIVNNELTASPADGSDESRAADSTILGEILAADRPSREERPLAEDTLDRATRDKATQHATTSTPLGIPDGLQLAEIVGLSPAGYPQILVGDETRIEADSLVPISTDLIGQRAALTYPQGHADRPIIVGIVQRPATCSAISLDNIVEREGCVKITAEEEVELSCGEASLKLTKSGRIVLRGTYILSRSTGTNSIKGAAIQID